MPAKMLQGTQLLHVGERPRGDKKFATDEYVLAPPGTIVAPRLKGEEPTPENAIRAIIGKAVELSAMAEGGAVAGPTAYQTYVKAHPQTHRAASRGVRGVATPKSGPRVFRRLRQAQEGAAVNPWGGPGVAEALQAIQRAQQAVAGGATMQGFQNYANLDATGAVNTAPAGQDLGVAEGSGQFNNLLQVLLGGAGITGPDNMLAQLAVMGQLGQIDPRALGVTDPKKFRELIGQGQGMPTLAARKQSFDESLYGFARSSPGQGNVAQTSSY